MVVMKEAGEFIRRGIISRVKSEQAIRRSKRLVQGTKNILVTPVPAPEAPAKARAEQEAPRTMEMVRQSARKLRETSRQTLERSEAVRSRFLTFRNRSSSTGVKNQGSPSKAA